MFVADWMTRQVITVGPDDSVSHAMHAMRERGIKHLPVVRDGAVIGVISDRDIKTYTPVEGDRAWTSTRSTTCSPRRP